MLFFGTGDREHPKATTGIVNRLYAVKDKNPSTILSENELVDVTGDLLQDPGTTSEQKTSILQSLQQKDGWFIKLDQNPGEKCLSVPVVFYGIVYYSTFSPTAAVKPYLLCRRGTSRLYELKYKTGNAVFNLDDSGTMDDLTRSDRSMVVGSAIPSGVIITFIGGTSVGYVGVGGGVYKPQLFSKRSIIPVAWRIVF
jgi:type IV pilus assembly protein PilY1